MRILEHLSFQLLSPQISLAGPSCYVRVDTVDLAATDSTSDFDTEGDAF